LRALVEGWAAKATAPPFRVWFVWLWLRTPVIKMPIPLDPAYTPPWSAPHWLQVGTFPNYRPPIVHHGPVTA
jgi:hypothetical protein